MKASSFTLRLSAALASVLLIAAALTLVLNYSKLRRTMLAQEASIFQLVTHQLSETIEASMNLGLALSMMENTQALLDRQKERDPLILELVVHNADGRVLFATDPARIGTDLPRAWVAGPATGAVAQPGAEGHSGIARSRLRPAFGQVAGGSSCATIRQRPRSGSPPSSSRWSGRLPPPPSSACCWPMWSRSWRPGRFVPGWTRPDAGPPASPMASPRLRTHSQPSQGLPLAHWLPSTTPNGR